MANKKMWAIAILLATVVGLVGVHARNVVLRSSQTFVGGGSTLTLGSNGAVTYTHPPRRQTGSYTLDTAGRFVVITWSNGRQEAFPFEWHQQGQTINRIYTGGRWLNWRR